MELLKPFLVPIAGLKAGTHQFDYQIDDAFFQCFEASPIKAGKVQVNMELDKRSDMIVLGFDFEGTTPAACDRCLADINLPLTGQYQLICKYKDETSDSQEDLVFIGREDAFLDVSKYIYEFICISEPLIKVYDCDLEEPLPCNVAVLDKLDEAPSPPEEDITNPIWDALKKDLK